MALEGCRFKSGRAVSVGPKWIRRIAMRVWERAAGGAYGVNNMRRTIIVDNGDELPCVLVMRGVVLFEQNPAQLYA